MIPRRTKTELKKRLICRKCFRVFENKSMKTRTACPNCGSVKDARIRTEHTKIYSQKHPERMLALKKYNKEHRKERQKIANGRVKRVVFNILSNNNPKCENCGCNDTRLLEINHKNGGGGKELQGGKRTNVFMWDIYMGRRETSDLNLLCRVCNALHYLKIKFGKIPMQVLWKS